MAKGIYLPKEENACSIGQLRLISLLNIDGKIMLGILTKGVIQFVYTNGYVNDSVQKAGIPGFPGCVEHTFAIWDAIRDAKESNSDLVVIWLDVANAYDSVPHALIEMVMEYFWFPETATAFLMRY